METNPETTELKNMVQNLSDLVVQVSKDVNRELSQMRGELNQINECLGSLEGRMSTLETRMSALETRVERRITDVFKWMVGMTVLVWICLLVAIITQFIKGQKKEKDCDEDTSYNT